MKRIQRAFLGRPTPIWTVGAVFVAAGCSPMVGGKALLAGSPIGPPGPVEWGPCGVVVVGGGGSGAGHIPAGAQCGKITVPIDYSKLDGAVANLALVRFPATGQKIGSLVINPGGPGGSGVGAAVGVAAAADPAAVRSGRIRPARCRLVQPTPESLRLVPRGINRTSVMA